MDHAAMNVVPPAGTALTWLSLAAALTLGPVSPHARAATVTATIAVTATVAATCLISASPLAFGTYTGAVSTSTSTLTVTCTNTTAYNVGLDAGTSAGATVTTRQMSLASSLLSYVLTQDAAYSVNWGQTVGTDTMAGTGTGTPQSLTVYGRVAAGQYVTPGAYADTVTVTVTF